VKVYENFKTLSEVKERMPQRKKNYSRKSTVLSGNCNENYHNGFYASQVHVEVCQVLISSSKIFQFFNWP
jgi:hypothetical protein